MAKEKEEKKIPTVFDLAAKYCKEFKDKNMAIKASIVPFFIPLFIISIYPIH